MSIGLDTSTSPTAVPREQVLHNPIVSLKNVVDRGREAMGMRESVIDLHHSSCRARRSKLRRNGRIGCVERFIVEDGTTGEMQDDDRLLKVWLGGPMDACQGELLNTDVQERETHILKRDVPVCVAGNRYMFGACICGCGIVGRPADAEGESENE